MNYQIFRKRDQAQGAFDSGKIIENKPIGFPHEGGLLKPYSNLFYWAHAWSDHGGLIDVHPHQGFEIMSFVIKGTIEHYDNKNNRWIQLHEGDVQIIRAGNGITHAERFLPGSHIFQIWVDPDLAKTLQQPASYDDYPAKSFPLNKVNGHEEKLFNGGNAPLKMDAPGLYFKELILKPGSYGLEVEAGTSHANYVIEGRFNLDDEELDSDDFFQATTGNYKFEVTESTRIFQVIAPKVLSYKSYAQLQGISG